MAYRATKPVVFQRRHFEFIAETLRNMPNVGDNHIVTNYFAHALQQTNAQFDVARFICACDGVPYKRQRRGGKKDKPVAIKQPDFSLAEIKSAERLIDKIGG